MLILRLCVMMFIQYVIWGSWYVTVTNYMTTTLGFTGTQAGAVFGTTAVASLLAPFIVGLVADRFVADRAVDGGLYALGAVIMVLVDAGRRASSRSTACCSRSVSATFRPSR